MKRFILTLIISALSLLITAYLLKDIVEGFEVSSLRAATLAALVLGAANATIRPLLSFITFPLRCLTLGLFSWVINAFMVWIVSVVIPGFMIAGPISAFVGSLVLTLVSGSLNLLFNPKKKR